MTEPKASDVARLTGNSLLAGLPLEDIGYLLEHLELRDVEPGAVLAASGAPGEGLCFLLDGAARREGSLEGASLSAGDCFGEHTLAREGRHACTVTATRPSRLARLSPEAWDRLAEAHPNTALHLARALLRQAAQNQRAAQRRAPAGPAPRREGRAFVTRAGSASAEVPAGTHVADLVPTAVAGSLVVGARLAGC